MKQPAIRLLPELVDPEPAWKRRLFAMLAILITVGFGYFILSYSPPAHPGVDQNGYLVGGKQLARTGSTGLKPAHPLQFIGLMWVMPTEEVKDPQSEIWYYPKYPIGLPLLNAIPLWINWERGKDWAYFVSPLSTALSLLAMFFLTRQLAGSFMGILGMLLLGVNPTTLALANNPNSHAPDLFFVMAGMLFLLRWWQTGAGWRGLLAGFLLGFAVTIRYSEGLLLLPLSFAVLCTIRYRDLRRLSWWRASLCILIATATIGLRLRFDLHRTVLLANGAGLLTLVLVIPIWRIRTAFHTFTFWRGVFCAASVFAVVLLNQPASLGLPLTPGQWVGSIKQNPQFHFLLILMFSFAGLILFIYAPRGVQRATIPLLAWVVPVLWLVGFNWFAMHSITGYDSTNESTGFSWASLQGKWEFAIKQLYDFGAFLFFPAAVLGLVVMWRRSARLAMLLILWLVPGVMLYASYYWGPQNFGLAYLRFFLTYIPGILLAALWFLRHGAWWRAGDDPQTAPRSHDHSIAMPIACGLLVGFSTWIAARSALPLMEREAAANVNLAFTGGEIVRHVPPGSIVFTSANDGLLNFIQWKGDYDLYEIDAFNSRGLAGFLFALADNGQASPLQMARQNYLTKTVYKGRSAADLTREQNQIMRAGIGDAMHPKRVFFIAGEGISGFKSRFLAGGEFEAKELAAWKEPATVLMEPTQTPLAPQGMGRNRSAQSWQIVEVIKKSSTTTSPTRMQTPSTTESQ